MNYFISDLHFGHVNCLSFDNRKFKTIEEHDEAIIKNWNETVGIEDDVYILGDISWYNSTKTIEIFKQLNGRLHLIKGNHDDNLLKNRELRSLFIEVRNYCEVASGDGKSIVLCHYPIPCFRNHYYGWYHLYGHVHNSFEWNMMENTKRQMKELYDKECKMFNVGVMMPYIKYTPRTLEQIIEGAKNNDNSL
jgi:calcineurin-like phosphoesterase family protein